MRNFTFTQSKFFGLLFFVLFLVTPLSLLAQVCGTPGVDGPAAVSSSVNTYYPINGNVTLNAEAQSIFLGGVPATDSHNNNFGTVPISVGDLILIIQMQDATIDYSNTVNYGSGTATSGPDSSGGTGFTALGNTGIFEYVIATNNVPLSGGNLTFKGTGANGGTLNSFYNANATTTRGKRTFQVIRVPQYSNLTLTADITTPPFNGAAGGVIAFNVSAAFDFAGFSINGSARGFRGGYSPRAGSGANDATTYVGEYTKDNISGKGEGIAGTPKYMWDGFNQVVNSEEGLPGGSSGRGAAANAGGGGNDHNTGGGGGGNGGFGGLGGAGWQGAGGDAYPKLTGAGRPGSKSYFTISKFPRLVMGGGGGAGDANDASSGVKGGVGGAIILVNAGNVLGNGFIYANGGKGAPGTYSGSPDGAGGGGAGGTVLLNVSNSSTSNIRVEANGGDGGNTENDANNEHGPGGGGGGGIICHNLSGTVTITSFVKGGAAGKSDAGNGITHGAKDGENGYASTFTVGDVPQNLQVNANCFPALETKVKTLSTTSVCNSIDEKISYEIQIKNTGAGNAAGVVLDFSFPSGIQFDSATATYSAGASGPSGALANTATANNPVFGGLNIAQNGVVTITLFGKVAASIAADTYSSNAQALYLDPTRTASNSTRKITAFTNGYGVANKTYEGASQANVPGVNFNGNSTTADDITILALPAAPTVSTIQPTCGTPTGTITVNTPANGSGISYTLTGTSPATASIRNTTGVFPNLVAGTYRVTTTNAQGCTSVANTGIVINPVTGAPATTGTTVCQNSTAASPLTATSACTVSSQVSKIAGTGSSVATGTRTLLWSNPENINEIDAKYASATVDNSSSNTTTQYLQGINFGFNIPTNATIRGIEVAIGRFKSLSATNVTDNAIRILKAGTIPNSSSNRSTGAVWSTDNSTVANYGSNSDLWNTSWTPADINNGGFGVALSAIISSTAIPVTASVNYMQITVSYTLEGVEWYTTATGGSPIYTGYSFNPIGVTGSGLANTNTPGTTTYYASCVANSSCRTATNFVINAKPVITGTTPAPRCGTGTVTLGATASAGTINWYEGITGGTSLGTGTTFTTPNISTSTSYYVDATDNGCTTPTRTEVRATVNTIPTINSTTEASRCGAGTLTLKATSSSGSTINWYADPTTATSLWTGTDFTTPSLSATKTYYVGATTPEGCTTSSRIAVAAVINTASTIVFTSGTQNPTVCLGTSIPSTVYTFGGSATNATVSNLPAGLSSNVDSTAKTVTISGTPSTSGTYTITTVGHTEPCTEATITGKVTTIANPAALTLTGSTVCASAGTGSVTSNTSVNGVSYQLYNSGGTAVQAAKPGTGSGLNWTGVAFGTGYYAVSSSATTPVCTSTSNSVNVSSVANPTALTLTGSTVCASAGTGSVTSSTSVSGVSYQLYNSGGTAVQAAKPGTGSGLNWTGVAFGTGYYAVSSSGTAPVCTSTSNSNSVNVSSVANPTALTLTGSTVCASAGTGSVTSSTSVSGVSYQLYNSGGTAVQAVKPGTGSGINWTGVAFGTGYYAVSSSATTPVCTSTSNSVNVSSVANPAALTLTGSTVCASAGSGSVTSSTSVSGVSYQLYNSGGTAVQAAKPGTGSGLNWTGVAFGTGYYAVSSSGTAPVCTSTSNSNSVDVSSVANPTALTLTGSTVCASAGTGSVTSSTSLNGVSYQLYNSGGTAVQAAKPGTGSGLNWTGVAFGTGYYAVSSSATTPVCTSNSNSVNVSSVANPTALTLTGSTVCASAGTGSVSSSTSVNGVSYQLYNSGGTAVQAAKPGTGSGINWTGVAFGTGYYAVSSSATTPVCTSNSNSVNVSSVANPTALTLTGSTVCASAGTGSVSSSTSVSGVSYQLYNSGGTAVQAAKPGTGSGLNWTGVAFGTGYYAVSSSGTAPVCTSTSNSVNVSSVPNPVKPILGSVTQPTCGTSTGSFKITNYNSSYTYDITPSGGILNTTTGIVTGTKGIYTVTATANNCISDVSDSVKINSEICAVDDPSYTASPNALTAVTVGNVTSNDTLNGAAVTASNTDVTPVSAGLLSIDKDGVLMLSPNTVSGTYKITYELCETGANPANCDTAEATVVVKGALDAVDDPSYTASPNALTAVTVGNVTSNDTLNGAAVASSNTDVTPITTGPLSIDKDGVLTLAPNTVSGTYKITYELCETGANPANCDTAEATVVVKGTLDAVNDPSYTASPNALTAVTVGIVTSNDTLNGEAVTASNTDVTPVSAGPLSIDKDGVLTLAPNTVSGTYKITYELCETGANPANCDTAEATVVVKGTLDAVNDPSYTASPNALTGVTVGNVTSNDTLNGAAVTASNTDVTPVTTGPLSIDKDGVLTLSPNTVSGTYKITYELCETGANPANCDTAEATVVVKGTLDAVNDPSYTASPNALTAVTVGSVTSNDTLNGVAVTASNTDVTPVAAGPLSIDKDGVLTLSPNTVSGTYKITYELCETGANSANCDTAEATVVVKGTLDAVNDPSYTASPNALTAVTVGNVTSNDTLNGVAVTASNTDVTPVATGPLSIDKDGVLTLSPNTVSGTYKITYELCETGANPANCDTAEATVVVKGTLDAVNDPSYTASPNVLTAVTVGNVTSNDTLNGAAVTASNTDVTPIATGPLSIDKDGVLTLAPNTVSGTYKITYELCETGANPANCDTAEATVVVKGEIKALIDTITPINGNIGGTTISLTANDTLNGSPFIIGTNPGEVSINIVGTLPTGLTLNNNGTITVAPNTPAANYNVEYTICEVGANPANCDTVVSVVPVTAGDLVANADPLPSVAGSNTSQTLGGNVLDNDTKNGAKLNPADVILTESTPDPKGYLVLNPDGTVTLGANAPAGNYELTYTICEKLNSGNCKSNTVSVAVTAPVIDAVAETTPSINGNVGGITILLTANDTLNGSPFIIGTNPGEVTLNIVGTLPTGLTLNADGTITVAPNTPKGDYNVEYRICDNNNSGNCDTVVSVVPVTAGDLVANADPLPSVAGSNTSQTLGGNVLDNDTKNGAKLNPADVILTESTPDPKGYLVLNPDGTVTLGANAPAGNYELTYTICEKLNSGNCKSNTVSVTVTAPFIDAVAETTPSINGNVGGTTISLTANDTLNGSPFIIGKNPGQVTLNIVGTLPTGLTLNADGTITVAPNTPKGDYNVEYRICDNNNSGNCDTVVSVVPVVAGDLVANADPLPSVAGSNTPQTLGGNVLDNDTKNGAKLNPADVILTESTPDPKGYLALNPDGTVTLVANAPAGNYELTYSICEKLNSGNCKSNTVTVTVTAPVIDAVAETLTPSINGSIGGTTTDSVIGNDTLNGNPAVIGILAGQVKLTAVNVPTGLTLNADGTVTVAANTPSGVYDVEYRICEITNPSNCDIAISKVAVNNGVLVANSDDIPAVTPSKTVQNLGVNIFTNDTKNGTALNPSDVNLTISTPDPKGYLTVNSDGSISLGANAPVGDYELTYTICEKLNAGNCSSNTVRVTVYALLIDAVEETLTPSINGSIGGTTTSSVIENDTLNGSPAVIGALDGQVKLTAVNVPAGLTLNADGTVTVAVNTPSGIYNVEYSICENANPSNCDTAISKVAVNNGILIANADNIPSIKVSNTTQNLGVNIFTNDTKNGVALNPSDVNLTTSTPDPKGYLTVNSDGSVSLGANAPAGDYELTYTICEKINAGNCSSNTVRITVESNLVANLDSVPSAVGIDMPQTLINVFANDTKDGNPLVPSDVILTTTVADPKGYLTVDANGNAILAPNAPAGDYELTYSICDKSNSSNCSTNVVKVTVAEPKMTVTANSYCSNNVPYVNYTVTPENFTANNQLTIKWIDSANNVVATQTNLPLSGNVIWPGAVVDSNGNGIDWPGWILNNGQWTEGSDGFELTRNGVKMEFSVNPTVTVSVAYPGVTSGCNARPTFAIIANNDEDGPIDVKKGMNPSINIFANDFVNGVRPNPSEVVLTTLVTNPNVTLNANGTVSIAPNTPNGVYNVSYQICEVAHASNCSQPALVKITVVNSVDPVSPEPSAPNKITLGDDINISVDGINGDLEFVNVLGNDLINGQPINLADVIVKPLTIDNYFEWNADGTVSVKPNTPGKAYTLTYQVCEKADPLNCSTAVLNVFVEVPAIAVVKTATFNDENKNGFANAGETITYKFTVTNTGNVPLKGITINDPLPGVAVFGQAIDLAVNESNESNFTAVYKITQQDINRGSVSNQAVAKGSSARGVVVEDQSDDSNNNGDNATVINLDGCSIEVLKAFSPNGDSKNERFYIRGIECYPDNTVEIYNRWGVLVFSIDQYNNTDRAFVGYSNGRSTIKQTEGLPVGTYFYILKYKDNAKMAQQKSGYLYINK